MREFSTIYTGQFKWNFEGLIEHGAFAHKGLPMVSYAKE